MDGLRAVAVLLVLLCHARMKGFEGGFVGVDVFFVISGYLISRNILAELSQGAFSFANFYRRRVRRIFPAMFVTLALSLPCACLVFSAADLERYATSLLSSSAGVQNIYFWTQAGYWDAFSESNPLLHFWSLGVEEQFYLFWPFLLWAFWALAGIRRGRNRVFGVILLVALLSLCAAQYFLKRDPTAVFYLTPFRIFEFCIGALLIPAREFLEDVDNAWLEILLTGGIAALGYCVRSFSKSTPFPGAAALIPCVAAGMIIVSGNARWSGANLRNPLMAGIGLISYSLYLVHWPVFVFYRYFQLRTISVEEKEGLIALSFLLALCLYRFVEQPFRRTSSAGAHWRLFLRAAVLAVSLASTALFVKFHAERLKPATREITALSRNTSAAEYERGRFLKTCLKSPAGACRQAGATRRIAIVGDSFADDLAVGLHAAYPDYDFQLDTEPGCKALLGFPARTGRSFKRCKSYNHHLFEASIDWSAYDTVVLAMSWNRGNLDYLSGTIAFFRLHGARRLVVAGPKVVLEVSQSRILARSRSLREFEELSSRQRMFGLEKTLTVRAEAIAKAGGAEYLDLARAECPRAECPNLVPGTEKPMTWDDAHWTLEGARYVLGNTKAYFRL